MPAPFNTCTLTWEAFTLDPPPVLGLANMLTAGAGVLPNDRNCWIIWSAYGCAASSTSSLLGRVTPMVGRVSVFRFWLPTPRELAAQAEQLRLERRVHRDVLRHRVSGSR